MANALQFKVERVPLLGHGMFAIPALGVEHLETMWEALNLFCRVPIGNGENRTSMAYRELASDMRHAVKSGLDLHYNSTRP